MANLPVAALDNTKAHLVNALRHWLLPLAQRLAKVPVARWRMLAMVLLGAWILTSLARLFWVLLPIAPAPVAALPVPVNAGSGSAQTAKTAAATVDIETLVGWHLFGEVGAVKTPNAGAIEAQAQDSALNLQLFGLVQSNDDAFARAILLIDGQQQQFAIGEQLPASGKVALAKVLADRAIIDNNGHYETLWLYDPESMKQLGTSTPVVTEVKKVDLRVDQVATATATGYRDQLYQNPTGLADLIQVSMQKDGLRIRPGRDSKSFAAFGLKADDVVTAINGVSVTDPQHALELYNQMRTAQEATFTIRRGGEDVVIAVSLQGAAGAAAP